MVMLSDTSGDGRAPLSSLLGLISIVRVLNVMSKFTNILSKQLSQGRGSEMTVASDPIARMGIDRLWPG